MVANGTKNSNTSENTPGVATRILSGLVRNASLLRSRALSRLLNQSDRDINKECGYPDIISSDDYWNYFEREAIGKRIVKLLPEETWVFDPDIYETEKSEETPFEQALRVLDETQNLFHYMERIDILCGVGRFGVLLLGFDDGKNLREPVEGVDDTELPGENTPTDRKLLFIRALPEKLVKIKKYEENRQSPRYGKPLMYSVKLVAAEDNTGEHSYQNSQETDVHWSRVIHVADNCESSEVFGTERLKCVFNRVHDIRKVLSGSGEMFWKGGFPGYSLEVDPEYAADAEIDTAAVREEMDNYANSLQRYIALKGMKVNSLDPQIADPTNHIDSNLKLVAIAIGCPFRVLIGSEEARLASSQDIRTWNKRLKRRQKKHNTPRIIRPLINRLIAVGVLPKPERYFVDWPDLDAPTDADKADIAVKRTDAMSKYMASGAEAIMPPLQFLTKILGLSMAEAEEIVEDANAHIDEMADREKTLNPPEPPLAGRKMELGKRNAVE